MKITYWLMAIILLLIVTMQYAMASPKTIYLFRHSEKQLGQNPSLSLQGQQRANRLIDLISADDTVSLFSTDYKRTRETAAPLSDFFNIPVQIYNARALDKLKQRIIQQNNTVVVIGHSNTTPQLAQLLSNEEIEKMAEDNFNEYYILQLKAYEHKSQYSVKKQKMNF
ncbi:phosphoglycerate mutase family protein [Pseudoalteromonas sp. MMG010]|uniref:SixA phosphatase family protein n=1 Tax=Pseudoalteromonas sp. MMG010 TaxID=2822685 RepID=UPI001FFCAEF3|nr:phosphoglycerate mutase family protein [Pseudoalteromonas sp. MMG010]